MTPEQEIQLRALTAGGYDSYTALLNVVTPANLLTAYPDVRVAAALMLDVLVSRASTLSKLKVGPIELAFAGVAEAYRLQAKALRDAVAAEKFTLSLGPARPGYVSARVRVT